MMDWSGLLHRARRGAQRGGLEEYSPIARSPIPGLRNACFAFLCCFMLQGVFWWYSLDHKPVLEVVPSVPSSTAVKAISFGDGQFFFRVLAFTLQNFGDTWGRYTPLKDYNYAKLERWFYLLDTLDNTSNHIPSMASYYFSQSQNPEDARYVVNYLRHHAEGRLDQKWWWQAQAAYLANHRLHDRKLALEIALPLVKLKNVPFWVNQMAAFLYEQEGEFESALQIMNEIQQNAKNIPPAELRFMQYFVEERLSALERKQGDNAAAPHEVQRIIP